MLNMIIPQISIAGINCNSLNMSDVGSFHHLLKVYGITRLKTDIICLSDVRLCNKHGVSNLTSIENTFKINPYGSYSFIHNSHSNKRGVGILLKISEGFSVLQEARDPDDNFLLLRLAKAGTEFIIGSIYGPNQVVPDFFNRLEAAINSLGRLPTILVGDWNCTYSSLPVLSNPDLLNYNHIPNIRHTTNLLNMCAVLNLNDPFRSLNPNRKEFSYIPTDPLKKNRSRLDFFIVSNDLTPLVSEQSILPGLQNKLFDHKAVKLSFKNKILPISRPTISHSALRDSDIDLVVALAVADTYLVSTAEDLGDQRAVLLQSIGEAKADLRRAGPNPDILHTDERSELELLTREGLITRVRDVIENFPFPRLRDGRLLGMEEDVNPDDFFMEGLMNNIRNEEVSHQNFASKKSKESRLILLKKLADLKLDYALNNELISELESKLNLSIDLEMRHELSKIQGFENLNNEKITPFFLKMARANKSEAKMSDIKSNDGTAFESPTEMKNYVTEFYANIYRKPETDPINLEGCIENFLGPELCNHPVVLNSKIPLLESENLEPGLTLDELDASVNEANKSASGMDGFSNCFIKKYWRFFRTPLLRYFNCCLDKGRLTSTFSTGLLRLIPKKGDTSKITNWRPISLLSCMYKVLSRALNNRLKKVKDYIFSRAQKGFTNSRYLQEVLINVAETIGFCTSHNIPGCLLAIDQAKAFDTISNAYMFQAYRFFGFGRNMIKILELLGTGRSACIGFDDGTCSVPFPLQRGRTQGNGPSPCEYNIGQQILLLKIELCPNVASVYNHFNVPRTVSGTVGTVHRSVADAVAEEGDLRFSQESAGETNKAEGFADDTSAITVFSYENLCTLKEILSDFAVFSGLRCNVDKTSLLQIGAEVPVPERIRELGFTITDSVKILGMDISNKLADLPANFEQIRIKIVNSIAFWERFKLSLPGRINVSKSLLISLLNHLGCFIQPERECLKSIQSLIDKFVKGKMNIAANRICLPVDRGGLGMINLDEFLASQQANWIFRCRISCRDNWRADIMELCNGNPFLINPCFIDKTRHPILFCLATSFLKLRTVYDMVNDNFLNGLILFHPVFFRNRREKLPLTYEYLGCADPDQTRILANLTFQNCFGEEGTLSREQLFHQTGLNLSPAHYRLLISALTNFLNRINTIRESDGSAVTIYDAFCTIKKPAVKIRLLLSKAKFKSFNLSTMTTTTTFFRLTDMFFLETHQFQLNISSWNLSYLPNRLRTFIFKFYNNLLGLNVRTSHFAVNQSRACCFCSISGMVPTPDETFSHLFRDCPTTRSWHLSFCSDFFSSTPANIEDISTLWFLGRYLLISQSPNLIIYLGIIIFQYCIWEEKLRKRRPSYNTIKNVFVEMFRTIACSRKKLISKCQSLNQPLCRIVCPLNLVPVYLAVPVPVPVLPIPPHG